MGHCQAANANLNEFRPSRLSRADSRQIYNSSTVLLSTFRCTINSGISPARESSSTFVSLSVCLSASPSRHMYLNSRSVTATNTGCQRSTPSSAELSEEAPLPSQALLLLPPLPMLMTRLLSHPMCLNSPIRDTSARFASTNAACVV